MQAPQKGFVRLRAQERSIPRVCGSAHIARPRSYDVSVAPISSHTMPLAEHMPDVDGVSRNSRSGITGSCGA